MRVERQASRGFKIGHKKINGNIFVFFFCFPVDTLATNQSWCEAFNSKQEEEQREQLLRCRLPAATTENSSHKRVISRVISINCHSTRSSRSPIVTQG